MQTQSSLAALLTSFLVSASTPAAESFLFKVHEVAVTHANNRSAAVSPVRLFSHLTESVTSLTVTK